VRPHWAPCLLLVGVICSDAAAQSLGELGRREDARRKQVSRGKVLTDADIPSQPKPVPTAAPAPPAAPAKASPDSPSGGASRPQPPSDAKPNESADVKNPRDETYWREGARTIDTRLQRLRTDIAAVEGRLVQLESVPGSKRESDVTSAALAKLRQELQFFIDERQRFEQKAQMSNVPLEWLR
jgi:hypothetical protein